MTANWYGPMNIDVEGIIQAIAINEIINNETDQWSSNPKPWIVIKKFIHSKVHIKIDVISAYRICLGESMTSKPLKNELHNELPNPL